MPTTINDFVESEPPPPPSKCTVCWRFIRAVLSFLLSHIGLLSLVVGYCIMGAFIFEELEYQNELQVKRNMTKNRHRVTEELWEITSSMQVLRQEEWTTEVTSELRNFEKSLIIALKEKGWDGKESEDTVTWSFAGGLFYSITVITTIGYGHIAPKTAIAKIVTIFYAILGIPLTVLCWSNIGDAMANAFRFCYWRICCYICTKKPRKKRKNRALSRNRGMSMRQPSTRGRSVRRQRTSQRSADTISDSLNSYSISDPERFYDEGLDGQFLERAGGIQRNRPSRRSLPRSLNQVQIQQQSSFSLEPLDTTKLTEMQQQQQPGDTIITGVGSLPLQSPHQTVLQSPHQMGQSGMQPLKETVIGGSTTADKEKKPSTASRVARGLGLKKSQKSADKPNGTTTVEPVGNCVGLSQSMPSSPTGGTPPILVHKGQKASTAPGTQSTATTVPQPPPFAVAPQQQSQVQQQQMQMQQQPYRLDRVPEDEWTMMEDPYYYADEYMVSEDEMEDYSTKPVPIWLSICLVIGYIVGGAFLFQEWEGWSMLDSSYFCFITLTTIGFGDLTPDQKNTDGEIRIALCSLYLLFGIAMICMSFNLVQEEVINHVKGIAKQLGILKDDEEEEDY